MTLSERVKKKLENFVIGAMLVGTFAGFGASAGYAWYNAPMRWINRHKAEFVEKEKTLTLDDYLAGVIHVESKGDPNAVRYESKVDDANYGLGQILTRTAKQIGARHPDNIVFVNRHHSRGCSR